MPVFRSPCADGHKHSMKVKNENCNLKSEVIVKNDRKFSQLSYL